MSNHKFKAFALLSTHEDLSIVDNLECVVEMKNFGEGICKIYGKALKPGQQDKTTHGCRTCIKRKKMTVVFFFIFVHKNVYRIGFQEIKIRPWEDFELGPFFSLFLMRKRLSSGQKWFLRPYFPLIRGMFEFRSGLRFSFRALEVPEPRVRKRSLSLTKKFQAT